MHNFGKLLIISDRDFFNTHLWFPTSDHDFWRIGSDFRSFCEVITEKNIVEEIESEQSSLSSLCSTEIMKVNSVVHGCPWWILYTDTAETFQALPDRKSIFYNFFQF